MRQHAAVAAYIQKYNQYAQEPLGYEYKDKLDELIKGTHRPAQGPQATRVAKALGLAESPNQDRPAATVPSQQKPSGAAAPPVPAKPATTAAKPVPARPVAQPAAQTAQPPSPKPTAPAVQLPFADEGGKLTGAMTRLSNATAEERTQLLDTLAPRLTRMLEETRKMSGQDPAAVDRAVRKIANGMALYKHYTNQDHPAFNDLVKAYPSAANPASPDPFADLDEAKTVPPLIGTTEADRKARKADPLRPRTDGERVMRWLAGAAGTAFRLGKKAATGGLALAEGGGNAIGKAGQWAGLIPRDEPEAEQADAAPQAQKPKPTAAGPLSPPLVHQNDLDSIQRIIAKRGSTEALMGKLERIGEGDPAKVADKLLTQLMDRVAAGQPATVAHTVNGESYQMRYTPAIATKPPQIVFAKVAPQTLPVEPLPPEELAPLEKAAGEVSEPGAIRPPKKAIEAAKGIEGGLKAALEARGFSDPADLRRAVGGAAQAIQWGKYNADDFAEMSTKGKVVQLGKLRGVLRVVEEDGKKKYKLSIPKVKPKEEIVDLVPADEDATPPAGVLNPPVPIPSQLASDAQDGGNSDWTLNGDSGQFGVGGEPYQDDPNSTIDLPIPPSLAGSGSGSSLDQPSQPSDEKMSLPDAAAVLNMTPEEFETRLKKDRAYSVLSTDANGNLSASTVQSLAEARLPENPPTSGQPTLPPAAPPVKSPTLPPPAAPPVQPDPQTPAAGTTMAPEVVSPPVDEQPTAETPAPPKKPKGGTVARVRKPQGSKPVPPTTPPTTEPEPTPTAGNLPAPPDGIPGLKKPRDGYVMASDNRWYPPDTITQETDETPPPTRPTRARVVRKKGAKPAAAPGKPRASKQPPA